jgi:cardiolipin synthase A/B
VSRRALAGAGLAAGTVFAIAHRRVLGIPQPACWPPGEDAVTAPGAKAATRAFAARDGASPRDATLEFAWSTAATLDPWADGEHFFPRILADVEAARSSVHILMFGWREGEIGTRMAELLERKLAEGVQVRASVDAMGSRVYGPARTMFTRLAAAGAQIVVNDVLPPARHGLFPAGLHLARRQDELGRVDHRKLYVIDGAVAWTGGAGLEDHFADGRFHDVMLRVTGAVVGQAQAAFLTSFHARGGPLPDDLAHCFPEAAPAGATPAAVAQVIPGGFVAASQAIATQIEAARERLDVMNPYLTDRAMVERILAAARRGVRVRVVLAQEANSALAAAAARHRYADLHAAGAEVWELPGTVVHAKVVVADDLVSIGTVNLDAWALYRNFEIALLARSRDLAALVEERLFAPDIARSRRAEPPAGRARIVSRLAHPLTYYL